MMKQKKLRTLADVKVQKKRVPSWDEIKEDKLIRAMGFT